MKTATLKQSAKVTQMIIDKGTPDEQLQWMLESGALSDLLDANPEGFDREAYRKFLGLKPLNLPLLIPVGTATVAATKTPFVAYALFVMNIEKNASVKISYLDKTFSTWFLEKMEGCFTGSALRYTRISRHSFDGPIITALGGEKKAETTLTELFSLMEKQPNGESGALLTNGGANIFYVKDASGVLRAVHVAWIGGWGVFARPVAYPLGWFDGRQVFSRDSR
jgi:hypothetical protein